MAFNDRHPQYEEFVQDWKEARDAFGSERVIKDETTEYLPATAGQIEDGQGKGPNTEGQKAYDAYLKRALFHDFMSDAVEAAVGIMHQKPATIELPKKLEVMLDKATTRGESLQMLLRRINESQLIEGRIGLFMDLPPEDQIPKDRGAIPFLSTYSATSMINWDDGFRDGLDVGNLNLVVLDESGPVRNLFTWREKEQFRVLILGDLRDNEGKGEDAKYRQFVSESKDAAPKDTEEVEPNIQGVMLDEIPFVFINSGDILPDPDKPPLIGLVRLSFAIYRLEADYRQLLFNQGQDTLVIIGDDSDPDDTKRTGAGAGIKVPLRGDAKYIGVSGKGLTEMREALENDKKRAGTKGGQLLDSTSRQKESEGALNVRVASQTATLRQIALTSAGALEKILKLAAKWVGAEPDEVKVIPNTDLTHDTLTGKTLLEFMQAKAMGLKLSDESIHEMLQRKNITSKTFEEESDLIESEAPIITEANAGLGA